MNIRKKDIELEKKVSCGINPFRVFGGRGAEPTICNLAVINGVRENENTCGNSVL